MKWYVTLALLVLCSSCTPTEKRTEAPKTQSDKKRVVTPYLRPDQVYAFNGTFYAGKGSKNPELAVSSYLKADIAGLRVTQNGASIYINVKVLKEIPKDSYIKVEFPDPNNPSAPYVNGIDYKSGDKGYKFTSPSDISGLKIGKDYKIKISVLKTKDSTKPVDVLVQAFRSYVDTTKPGRPVTLSEYLDTK
ncbi:MAG: hypothetical protein ABR969_01460 [Sedimentisphaerales bacterium]|jgi:hypothetical protein